MVPSLLEHPVDQQLIYRIIFRDQHTQRKLRRGFFWKRGRRDDGRRRRAVLFVYTSTPGAPGIASIST